MTTTEDDKRPMHYVDRDRLELGETMAPICGSREHPAFRRQSIFLAFVTCDACLAIAGRLSPPSEH